MIISEELKKRIYEMSKTINQTKIYDILKKEGITITRSLVNLYSVSIKKREIPFICKECGKHFTYYKYKKYCNECSKYRNKQQSIMNNKRINKEIQENIIETSQELNIDVDLLHSLLKNNTFNEIKKYVSLNGTAKLTPKLIIPVGFIYYGTN